ncbi:MAG: UvrD-helicase domain-containing protein [Spirochaetes bacterium]|nr:UvrD-helicase domain-containing protein [Spirochaetota bacterium]
MEEFEIDLANLDKNIVIEASAGTGKTYSLEHLVVRYIAEKGYDISEILVVTFTKKATFELENRIRTLLKNKVREMDSGGNKVYAKRLKNAFSCFADSQIYTIHGFCQYCIHNFPFESGVSFRTSVMNSEDIYKEASFDYLRTAGYSELSEFYLSFRKKYKNFSDIIDLFISMIETRYVLKESEIIPDQQFVEKTEKYCKEFSSNKGELYSAIKQLSECDYTPPAMEEISKKMKLRFRGKTFETLSLLLGIIAKAQAVGEVFCDAFLEDAARLKKYSFDYLSENKDTSSLNSDELFLTRTVSDIFNALEMFKDSTPDEEKCNYVFHNIASYIFIKNASLKIIDFAQQKKKTAALFDFDDLIEITRKAVTMNNGNSPLANELRRKYKVVLIDEFQDTDLSQWEIFSTIFKGDQHKIVLIGDPKQSIYRFRGGDLEVYFKAVNALSNATAYRLATCYRSTDNIVKGVNDIFSKVFSFASGGGHKITYSNVKSCKDNPKLKKENKLQTSVVELIAIENETDEKSRTDVEKIVEAIYGNEIVFLLNQGVQPSSIAILMDTNDSCKSMLEYLKKLGVPAMYEGELNIFDSCEAYQFVDLLYALSYPNDMAMVRKSLFSEFFALSADDIINIENSLHMDRTAEIFALWSEKIAKGKLYEVFDEVFYKKNPVASLIREDKDINKPYFSRTLEELGGRRKAANVMQIYEMLIVKNMLEKQDAASLLRYMMSAMKGCEQVDDKSKRLENEPDCIKIMTIHGSKGREFRIVFFSGGFGSSKPLPAMENYYEFIEGEKRHIDFTKSTLSREKQFLELWEEKKRLYYVAMTRASEKLYIPVIKNSPGTDLVSFYASLVFDKLSGEFAKNGIDFSIPVNTQKISLPKDMKVTEFNTLFCNRSFELIEDFCKNKQYLKFRKTKSCEIIDAQDLVKDNKEDLEISALSCPTPLYKKDDAIKGFWVYSYSMLVRNAPQHDLEIRNLETRGKEPDNEEYLQVLNTDSLLSQKNVPEDNHEDEEENIGLKGADFGNIMHKILETASFSKVLQHKDIDSAIADPELLDFAEQCARDFVNSELAYKSRISTIKLLYKTLATPINAGGALIRIGDIPESDRKHELDFMFKIKQGKINFGRELNNITLEDGFIKGFIDMIFRFNGYYYIVDWKTNFLGSSLNDYELPNLERAMISNNYILQTQLYTIALDMLITAENKNSFEQNTNKWCASIGNNAKHRQNNLGGCFFLFLRGLDGAGSKTPKNDSAKLQEKQGTGVYFTPPDYDAIDKFKKTFLE